MKQLLTLTAVLEAGAGLALLGTPALVSRVLLGAPLDAAGGPAVGRVAGAALLALGVACWGARDDGRSRAAAGIVTALLLYNVVVAVLLVYLRCGPGLSGPGLWPAAGLHVVMTAWCIGALRSRRIAPGTDV